MSGRPWTDEEGAIVARMVAAGATRQQIADAVGRTPMSVDHYRLKTGGLVLPPYKRPKPVMPKDFADKWAIMPIVKLAKHYRAGPNTVRGWAASLGLSRTSAFRSEEARAKPRPPKVAKPVKAKRLPDVTPIGRAGHTAPIDTYQRDMSPAGQAADYLRQFAPVYHCNALGRAVDMLVNGKPNRDATHWRWGNVVLTSNELIERAASKRRREAERRHAA